MAKLIGTKPNQVPTNADLGELAYQGNDRLANIPRKGQALTASYKLKAEDAGHWFKLNSGASITIPNEVFQDGDVVTLYNNTNSTISITCNPTTVYIAGNTTNKNGSTVTLAARGVCTILFASLTGAHAVLTGNVS